MMMSHGPPQYECEGRKIYIGNLNENAQKDEVTAEFEKFGQIVDVHANKGFAFITFSEANMADDAIKDMDGANFMGEKLKVRLKDSLILS